MNIAQALVHCTTLGLDRLDAQLLLLHVLGRAAHDRAWLLAHDTDLLPPAAQAALDTAAQRRRRGEPLAYIVGYKAFYGLDLAVDARVLVPRPDTETLVDWTLELLSPAAQSTASSAAAASAASAAAAPPAAPVRVADLGTGSGAIALALQHQRPDWEVHAVDRSADALDVARANAQRLGLGAVQFHQGSWLAPLRGRFHAIVSNPPYIASADPHLAALQHEPQSALTSGTDGLDDLRSLVAHAAPYLLPCGWLLLEHGYNQAARVRALLQAAGFTQVHSRTDLAGIERCSGGQLCA